MSSEEARLFLVFGIGVVLTLITGFYSIITTRNLIRTLIGLEVLTKGATLAIIVAGYISGRMGLAQALAITLIVIEVVVMVVAVGIVLGIFRHSKSLDVAMFEKGKD